MAGMDVERNEDANAPLLSKPAVISEPSKLYGPKAMVYNTFHSLAQKFRLPQPDNVMQYETSDLAQWHTFSYVTGTLIQNHLLWDVIFRLVGTSFCVAFLLILTGVPPEHVKILNLDVVTMTLNVFVGLMLAFFMNNSVQRWLSTINGLLQLFDSIRNLSMQLHALGVPESHRKRVCQYGLMSCDFLVIELQMKNRTPEEQMQMLQAVWDDSEPVLEEWEREVMHSVYDKANRIASQVWVWIASYIGHLAQTGYVPPMPSPTYGRIIQLAQDAQEAIRQVRISINVQLPFLYSHTLAVLVHSNNIFSALEFGATLSTHIAALLWHQGVRWENVTIVAADSKDESVVTALEAILRSFITRMVAPFMYQAFFQIGLSLAQPFDYKFGSGLSAIPTDKLIHELRRDLEMSEIMARGIQAWEAPRFKQPSPSASSTPAATKAT